MLRTILHYPDERLRTVARPVQVFDPNLAALVADMAETMYHNQGIGLAATQINVHQRIVVIDVSDTQDQLQVYINPTIEILSTQDTAKYKEGCLSVPDVFDVVKRPTNICVRYQDTQGKQQEEIPSGLLAVCIQHECDHLNGKLFIDRLSSIKRDRLTQHMRIKPSRRLVQV